MRLGYIILAATVALFATNENFATASSVDNKDAVSATTAPKSNMFSFDYGDGKDQATIVASKEERLASGGHTEVGMPIGGGTDSTSASAGYTVSGGTSLNERFEKWWKSFKKWWKKTFGTSSDSTSTRRLRLAY
ncbi:hypothetical protein PHYBOEH_003385 [Phytophthora boehmeriae]|uniref:RxLR effector protein n=1 Tax=Phytophthora boehmeriae TaxID=109152 RepID=A0A8T1WQD6_9STRA|nr:hypothetical protein PHYBOEH_003385 [Phytophthora boehmeriae]